MLRSGVSVHLVEHVVDDVGVLVLRAEHHDLGVRVDPDIVSRRPVEKVAGTHRFVLPPASVVVIWPRNT